MRTEEILDQCMQALSSGQDLSPELARYLARHPEQRAEVEEMLFVAQRVSRLPSAQLNNER
jgi:SOS response regulatory protein OraA/RecX